MRFFSVLFAQQAPLETLEWARLPSNGLQWLLLAVVAAAIAALVIGLYRRDSSELPTGVGPLLATLRLLAFAGLLVVWLHPQNRVETELREESVVAVAVDVSLSMGIRDDAPGTSGANPSRSEQVIKSLAQSELVSELRKKHVVMLTTFGRELGPIARLPRVKPNETASQDENANLENPDQVKLADIDWAKELTPRATETRIGEALRRIISQESGKTLVGVIMYTDGQQNAGVDSDAAVKLAQENRIRLCAIGMGSERSPINARVGDVIAPARAYPGDDYTVTAYVQGQGLSNRTVNVELVSRPAGAGTEAETVEEETQVVLEEEGKAVAVSFTLKAEVPGRRTLQVRLHPVDGDRTPGDDAQEVDVEVVERKTRVLLFAGGPTREYRFLRNQLHRDPEMTVDVLLQTAQPGISQDADAILDTFPETAAELAEYDCLIAFDPNWLELSEPQAELMEKWVAEQSGGLVVIAGPVYAEGWIKKDELKQVQIVRSLYPVQFSRHQASLDASRFQNREPSPIRLTRDGLEANFLWIEDSAVASRDAWDEFAGVYGYFDINEPKPAATVYARFSNPNATQIHTQPIYFAGHFYGSGRVFYLGSGEMWRTRAYNEAYFERFYTKLIRYVSEGRLLRGSKRGVLLVERDRYLLGQSVAVRAQLTNAELQPLEAASVTLDVIPPDNSTPRQILLKPDAAGRKGMYNGQFNVLLEGAHRLELAIPGSPDEERLTRRIQVKISDRERENPRLNEPKLMDLAKRTGGRYLRGANQATSLLDLLPPKPTTEYRLDRLETLWDTPWLLGTICGLLFLEWLIRRLSKMA
ncbi:MAG: VWA domain-containing protein [Planctomycetales bacterium]